MSPLIRGDVTGLLERGPANLLNPSGWSKRDSEVIAHFLQVHKLLITSRWFNAEKSLASQGDNRLKMPDLEQFIFAAVYFRQLVAPGDDLVKLAVDSYCRQVACDFSRIWANSAGRAFQASLDSSPLPFAPVKGEPTLLELFDAFIYGAGLFHVIADEADDGDKKKRREAARKKRFLNIYDSADRPRMLLALNGGMAVSLNEVSKLAMLMQRDFPYWQQKYSLPLPDVRWHEKLFHDVS